jgi:hypothetical protein
LYAENDKKRSKGVYVRPSGAIERGSGFFVPGLEGPRVRVVVGGVLLLLTTINHMISSVSSHANSDSLSSSSLSFSFQEELAVLYSGLILFQSGIEFVKEQRMMEKQQQKQQQTTTTSGDNLKNDAVLEQSWSSNDLSSDDKSKIQWSAASFVSMTPTKEIMLLTTTGSDGPSILYRLGTSSKTSSTLRQQQQQQQQQNDQQTITKGITEAFQELNKSKGGRISLPMTHPAVQSLLLQSSSSAAAAATTTTNSDTTTRTVILQRISIECCWMVVSDQLLASYAKTDLKFLGRLAQYVGIE